MNSIISKITATIIVSLCYFPVAAQHSVPNYEVGAAISAFIYQGDLTTHRFGSVETTRFGINLYTSKIISPSFMLRTNLAIGSLKGDDVKYNKPAFRKQRNFNFRTPVFEVAQLVVWNLLKRNYKDIGFSPYLFGGAGLSFLKIKRDWSNFNAAYFGWVKFYINPEKVLELKSTLDLNNDFVRFLMNVSNRNWARDYLRLLKISRERDAVGNAVCAEPAVQRNVFRGLFVEQRFVAGR